MANPEHLKILKQGVKVWNRWRAENPNIRPRLSRANLAGLNLSGVDLSGSSLREANLSGANLKRATLSNANLTGTDLNEADFKGANLILARLLSANCQYANFSNADLNLADFGGANLSGVNFSHADLSGANFNVTDLSGANFRNTLMGYTMFCRVDLREVEGLETAVHLGPSTIGVDTIYYSHGEIPKAFLQGAGVPPDLINYLDKIKTPECPHTLEQLELWIKSNQEVLLTLTKRIAHLENQQASYGPLNVPFHIVTDFEDAKSELEEVKAKIAEWKQFRDVYY